MRVSPFLFESKEMMNEKRWVEITIMQGCNQRATSIEKCLFCLDTHKLLGALVNREIKFDTLPDQLDSRCCSHADLCMA